MKQDCIYIICPQTRCPATNIAKWYNIKQHLGLIRLPSIIVPLLLWKLDLAERLKYFLQCGHVLNLLLQLLESRQILLHQREKTYTKHTIYRHRVCPPWKFLIALKELKHLIILHALSAPALSIAVLTNLNGRGRPISKMDMFENEASPYLHLFTSAFFNDDNGNDDKPLDLGVPYFQTTQTKEA